MDETKKTEEPTLPWSRDAELNVLGSVMLAGSLLAVSGEVTSGDFYDPGYRAVYAAIETLESAARPIDPITIADEMKHSGTLERLRSAGGMEFLQDLSARVVAFENAAFHARVVAKKAVRRNWVQQCINVAVLGRSDADDDEFFARAERAVMDLSTGVRAGDGPRKLKAVTRDFTMALKDRVELKKTGQVIGITTGFYDADVMLGGLKPGKQYVIAARPSMGKSGLAGNIAVAAAKTGVHVLVLSLEMEDVEVGERMMSGESRVDATRYTRGDMDNAAWIKTMKAAGVLSELPLWIEDSRELSMPQIRSLARRWKAAHAKDAKTLVICDYMQLVRGYGEDEPKRNRNREQEVAEVSRGLRALAQELDCPVISLAQVNRRCEEREDKRPIMADLRESGSIEQDADVIAFLYREYEYAKNDPKKTDAEKRALENRAELIVRKHRGGDKGTIGLRWLPQFTSFENEYHE